MPSKREIECDVLVIGGGPAGMMAARSAAELGAKVILIEKNKELGRKLLLTGKGRCNITNAEFNPKIFAKEYGKQGNFILSPFSKFGAKEAINFFEKNGLKIKIERGERVFLDSDNARDVLSVLVGFLNKNKVEIIKSAKVLVVKSNKNEITKVLTSGDRSIKAKSYIFCAGGKSYPKTGSTGDGFLWAKKLGHSIIKPRPSLVPIKIKEKWLKQAQGLSLKNVRIAVFQDGKKKDERFGEALFTHFGLSGPIILDLSKKISELLDTSPKKMGEIKLVLDLKPALSFEKLDKRIQRDFIKYQNKMFKNSLDDLLPEKLIPIFINFSRINPRKEVNKITREERHRLVKLFKELEMTVSGILGFERAIITSGGVSLNEIDSKTMKSKLIDNLFFAGEIIDLDGPCGGYNLQLCWTTGYVAGQNAVLP